MATLRVEYLKVVQTNNSNTGPDNVINEVLAAHDSGVLGAAAPTGTAAPAGTNAVRVTAIGGNAYVNPKTTATATASVRIAADRSEVFAFGQGRVVSAMAATS